MNRSSSIRCTARCFAWILQGKIAAIKAGKIGDWMEAMTMEYPVKDQAEFDKLRTGENDQRHGFRAGQQLLGRRDPGRYGARIILLLRRQNKARRDTLRYCADIMPAQVSETFVLRTYPYREADLIVSFFTRDQGKLRGVARRAKRPKSAFGSGLERLSHVRMAYFLRENSELANLSGCELIESQFALQSDYGCSLALDYFTEVTDQLMPPHEPNEKFFRLLNSTLEFLRSGGSMWSAVDYFTLWSVRLTGVLPELRVSNRETVEIVEEMFVKKLADLTPRDWTKSTLQGLRRTLIRAMEQHVERQFLTVPLLEAL